MSRTLKGAQSFVLFPLGKKRFALPADMVTELARPDRLQSFPHTTRMLAGVLLRRGRIVPVCDIAPALLGHDAPPRRFFLIANRDFGHHKEWTAIPVSGECELANTESLPVTGKLPAYVVGLLSLADEIVQVLDLERLHAVEATA